jgi:signal transduction histidine kinase
LISKGQKDSIRNEDLIAKIKSTVKGIDTILFDLNKILEIKNNLNLSSEEIDIQSIFDQVISTLVSDTKFENINFSLDFLQAPHVNAYKPYLISIIQNLISNSIKFRSPSRQLNITCKSKESDSSFLTLIYCDNGIGIDLKRYNEKLFKLYSRFQTDIPGTGMGLYLIREQLNAMQGTIQLESELDKGITVTINLPNKF